MQNVSKTHVDAEDLDLDPVLTLKLKNKCTNVLVLDVPDLDPENPSQDLSPDPDVPVLALTNPDLEDPSPDPDVLVLVNPDPDLEDPSQDQDVLVLANPDPDPDLENTTKYSPISIFKSHTCVTSVPRY